MDNPDARAKDIEEALWAAFPEIRLHFNQEALPPDNEDDLIDVLMDLDFGDRGDAYITFPLFLIVMTRSLFSRPDSHDLILGTLRLVLYGLDDLTDKGAYPSGQHFSTEGLGMFNAQQRTAVSMFCRYAAEQEQSSCLREDFQELADDWMPPAAQ